MSYDHNLLKKFNLASKTAVKGKGDMDSPIMNMMNEPTYLRQSSALINEALQKGFDVLQLANGDIVTTGTKTVVYQYTWDAEKAKLVKTKPTDAGKKAKRNLVEEEDEEIDSDSEEA